MRKFSSKRLLAFLLAAAMILSVVPYHAQAAANENLALNKPATASNVEGGTTFTADKAVDGSTATRWATDQNVTNPWLEVDLDDGSTVQQVNIYFERTDEGQNILSFKIEVYADGAYTTVYTHEEADGRCAQFEKVVLENPVTADKIKLTVLSYDGGTLGWSSVSVTEFEVYAAETVTIDDVLASLSQYEGTVVEGDTFVLPQAPDGYTIALNGADFEQLVANDLSVDHPLTDKVVQISYTLTDGAGGTATSGDIAYTVKGLYTQEEGMNAKPVVIPEIQEWYSDSTEKLAVSALTKVTYDDAALKTVVDEFVSDYELFTGIKLEAVQGEAQANAFNFSLSDAEARLGDEGYTMEITADRINVASVSTTGNMYGMQTILQMYEQDAEGYAIGKMRDYPRFEIRGLLLDMARKPIAMNMINDISRTMRYYKMNDFQLHLSDNLIFLEDYVVWENGVAVETGALNAYEAYRLECSLTNDAGEDPTAEDYFIKKEDMAAFIQGQRALGMNIVPEIDVPAHSLSFTKIWPEVRVDANRNGGRPLLDHFDLTKPAAVAKIKEIFDDYTKGDFITFDPDTVIHIGADEFTYDKTAYRNYYNEIIPYVKETNPTIRVWGSLSIIDDGVTEIVPEAIEGVQMNVWNTGWANPQVMYDMGYDVINTLDGSSYMVPSGSFGRGGYGDLLNLEYLFGNFAPNIMGGTTLPSGDDQMLGAVYAIWNDNIDTRACGLTESDMFYRFFDSLPIFAEKTWAATGQEKGSAAALTQLSKEMGFGPGTNPYYQVESEGDVHADYKFADMTDSSANDRDLIAGTASVENGALVLNGGDSYVSTPITKLGNGNALSFDITLTAAAEPGDILFECTPEYATHDIRIMEDGRLGFTRELYNYYFDYELPVGETVSIRIEVEQQVTTLYVNGELVGTATGKFIHNGTEKKTGITNSTFALPLERIGSETNSIAATIDNVRVEELVDPADDSRDIPVEVQTATAGDWQTGYEETEGPANLVLDGDTSTIWHTDWYGTSRDGHWIQFELSEDYIVDGLRYLPRSGSVNGRILEYEIQVSNDGVNFETITTGTWANNTSWKVTGFEGVQVKYVRLVALNTASDNSNYVFASAAEIRLTGVKVPEEHEHVFDVPGDELAKAATCTAPAEYYAKCSVEGCNVHSETITLPKGEVDPDNHTGDVSWGMNEVNHAQVYTCCGATVEGSEGQHDWEDSVCEDCGYECQHDDDADKDHKCGYCEKTLSECADANKDHKCDVCGETLTECVDENEDYKCDICGKDLEKPEQPTDPTDPTDPEDPTDPTDSTDPEDPTDPTDPEEPVAEEVVRLAGAHRWATSLMVADEMKANLGVEKFDAIIIASGNDFADALAGSYLSTVKNAPILLAWGKGGKFEYLDTDNIEYIKANLAEGGTVYILGGTNAVPELYENELKGYTVKRLGGANRFETNLLILAEAGVKEGSEVLVCTSTNFADSLSASATGMPILLVFNEYGKLYGKQPEFLAGLKNCTFTVIGGESAVSADLAKAIEAYGKVERLAGANRFETSVLVAEEYFEEPTTAVLAYAWNYPDGLCGGSLAYSLKAPLILTMTKYEAKAVEYAKSVGIETGIVLGGDTLISDDAVRAVFAMDAADEIIVKK